MAKEGKKLTGAITNPFCSHIHRKVPEPPYCRQRQDHFYPCNLSCTYNFAASKRKDSNFMTYWLKGYFLAHSNWAPSLLKHKQKINCTWRLFINLFWPWGFFLQCLAMSHSNCATTVKVRVFFHYWHFQAQQKETVSKTKSKDSSLWLFQKANLRKVRKLSWIELGNI